MPRFAANLSMLFADAPMLGRFERAARAGFQAVEIQFPYEAPAAEVAAALRDNGLPMVLHNLPGGNWAAGDRGIACHPGRVDEFRAGVRRALQYADALDVPRLNCLAGIAPAGVEAALLRRTFVENVRYAAAELKAAGRVLVVEPINPFDVPGFWLNRTDDAVRLLDEAGADNAFVQYDLYHAQRTHGELCGTLTRHFARIGHLQIADNPGRHEPGTGEIHWPYVFAHIDRLGYTGWVGCEYLPASTTEAGLGWMQALG
jgi:hydroxypyruvate isomerase